MSADASICMVASASFWAITKAAADAPTGSSAREAAIANARRVRTSRIALYLPQCRAQHYHTPHPIRDPAQAFVTGQGFPVRPTDYFHQFGNFTALIGFVAAVVCDVLGRVMPRISSSTGWGVVRTTEIR
jgi:hypothetical protein